MAGARTVQPAPEVTTTPHDLAMQVAGEGAQHGLYNPHPYSRAQVRWGWANLDKGKAHEWARRAKGKDLPERSTKK